MDKVEERDEDEVSVTSLWYVPMEIQVNAEELEKFWKLHNFN